MSRKISIISILILIIILIYEVFEVKAFVNPSFDPDWGIGIICRNDNIYEFETINFPDAKIDVYDSSKEKKIGFIGRKPFEKEYGEKILEWFPFEVKKTSQQEYNKNILIFQNDYFKGN